MSRAEDLMADQGKSRDPAGSVRRTIILKQTADVKKAAAIVDMIFRELHADYSELSHALSILRPVPVQENGWPSTDGEHYFYHPDWILQNASRFGRKNDIRLSVLHIVLHGLLGHFAEHTKYSARKRVWRVMDLQVAKLLLDLKEEPAWDCLWNASSLNGELSSLQGISDYSLYFEAGRSRKLRDRMNRISREVTMDDHHVWPAGTLQEDGNGEGQEGDASSDRTRHRVIAMRWEEARELIEKGLSREGLIQILITGRKSSTYGHGGGNGVMQVTRHCDPQTDYTQRLRAFFRQCEITEETDLIDPMLYEYGLSVYGDMPLIEPPEVTDGSRLKSIILAVDTSGSCAEAAGRFLGETQQIFRDVGQIGMSGKVHYIECDARIQKEFTFRDVRDLKQVEVKDMYGWGGTDFRPVFARAQEYIREGEEISLLIYLSDGYGDFVTEKPPYPVWFVLPKEDYERHVHERFTQMPDWVTPLCLN